MKITGNQVNAVSQVYLGKVRKAQGAAETEATPPKDTVELSNDAAAIETARQVIAGLPETRAEKVEELRRQVQDGTYQVSPEGIAEKMLTEMHLSKLTGK